MLRYAIVRVLFACFVVWGAASLIFVVVRLVPGDPALMMLGPNAAAEQVALLRESLGINEPIIVQYWQYLLDVVRFDFGESLWLRGDAAARVIERVPATAYLALTAMAMAIFISVPLGMRAAWMPHGLVDRVASVGSMLGQALPTFWVGIMLILVFARYLGLLPSAGMGSWRHFVLPAFTLALPFMSLLIRLIRGGMLDVLQLGYIQTARSKGIEEWRVLCNHALRNVLIPVITVISLQFGRMLGGAVVIETVFAWPGAGRLLVDAIGRRDYAIVQVSVALVAAIFVILNLVTDLAYAYVDPRVRIRDG